MKQEAIEKLPDTIEWTKVRDFLVAMGIEPDDVAHMEIWPQHIEITVFAISPDSGQFMTYGADHESRAATHMLSIPIVGDRDNRSHVGVA